MSKVLAKFRAKFRLSQIEDGPDGSVLVQFQGVQGEPFGSATPSAYVQMSIHNAAAAQVFKDAYKAYLAEIEKRRALDSRATPEALSAYPSQPEFYVTFKLDTGEGAE